MPIIFTSGATVVTITDFRPPAQRPLEKLQAQDRSASGVLHVEDFGSAIRTIKLDLTVPTAIKTALENFYNNTVNGAIVPFTYTDEEGVDYTVLWTDPFFNFRGRSVDLYEGLITLEVV